MGFMVVDSSSKTKKNLSAASTDSDMPSTASRRARRRVAELRELGPRRSTRSTHFTGPFNDGTARRPPPDTTASTPSSSTTDDTARPSPDSSSPAPPVQEPSDSPAPFYPPPPPERCTFERIMAHQGPLHARDKRYRGAPFNLKIRWSAGQTSWEPLSTFLEDQPHEVVEYARAQNLLGNPHWKAVRDLALDPTLRHRFPRGVRQCP